MKEWAKKRRNNKMNVLTYQRKVFKTKKRLEYSQERPQRARKVKIKQEDVRGVQESQEEVRIPMKKQEELRGKKQEGGGAKVSKIGM